MKNKQQLIDQLRTNPIVQIACQKTGISRATYYRWREIDPNFKELSDKALDDGVSFINDLAESQLLSAIKDKNITAIIFWLKNRNVAYQTTKLEITSPNKIENELNPEQQEVVKKALSMAGIASFIDSDKKTNE